MPTRSTTLASRPRRRRARATDDPESIAELLEDLGRKLGDQRARRRMTRTELANELNCSYDAVLSAEVGEETKPPTFWALADTVLRAHGKLLAAANRVSQHQAAAKRASPNHQARPISEEVKLARFLQVRRRNRVFADRLSTTAASRQRCPYMAKQAVHQRTRIKCELAALNETIHTLLRRPDFTPDEVVADLWQTLLTHDPFFVSFLSTAALIELARSRS